MDQNKLPKRSCGACEKVFRELGEHGSAEASAASPDYCDALNAALTLIDSEAHRKELTTEFVKQTGSPFCDMLNGPRCDYYSRLAAGLVRQYRSQGEGAGKIKVLLLGDSIRGNYQNIVKERLQDRFEVTAPEENGRFAKYTLNELERIFQTCGEADIIHWNNGLWDSAIVCKEDGTFTSPQEYLFYMSRILRELRKHTPHIIFATTTPVGPNSLNQKIEYIDALNRIIVPYMNEHAVQINDLYALLSGREAELLADDCIHLNRKGCELCGQAVADSILKAAAGIRNSSVTADA